MAAKTKMALPFVGMTSIKKAPTFYADNCSDWVATEKVHGASFQFFTNDGENIYMGSRRNALNFRGSFQKCALDEFHRRHYPYVNRLFQAVQSDERWSPYRNGVWVCDEDDEEPDEDDEVAEDEDCAAVKDDNPETEARNDEKPQSVLELRIYGELYGGGGVEKDIKPAVQKEIIYSDEFRFYVFAISINLKWTTIAEMNDLCRDAGFPYYATPVCEPKATLGELKDWVETSGFMKSKSRLTDRTDNYKTLIEGVVMTPLTRKGFRLYPIKQLAEAFSDVRHSGTGKNQRINYCTKARYHSVISKLDIHERENTDMVIEMYIEDVLQESGESEISNNKRKGCIRMVTTWLAKDGYTTLPQEHVEHGKKQSTEDSRNSRDGNSANGARRETESEIIDPDVTTQDDQDQDMFLDDIGGLFS